ncbi:MAG: recombinase family protein, partial [Nocardiaceae bacterium]|nr:recombinase family protein [Nocardiaceae bacterium]
MSVTTAAVYLRQSLDVTGEGVAVARQREDCLRLCAEKGWTPSEYLDNDTSATKGKRPGYLRMLDDIRAGTVQAVVAWDLDRLHRRPVELEEFINLADAHRLALATVSGDVDLSTAQGRLVARLKGSVARHEIEHKSDRQKRAAKQLADVGAPKWKTAFGYTDDYQPHPIEAPLVRDAYEALLSGTSLKGIAAGLNANGMTGRTGKPWTHSTVSLFLRAPRNAGLREHNKVIVGPGTWPGLVSEETFRAALADRKSTR